MNPDKEIIEEIYFNKSTYRKRVAIYGEDKLCDYTKNRIFITKATYQKILRLAKVFGIKIKQITKEYGVIRSVEFS